MHDQTLQQTKFHAQDHTPILSFHVMQPNLRLQLPKFLNYCWPKCCPRISQRESLHSNPRANASIRNSTISSQPFHPDLNCRPIILSYQSSLCRQLLALNQTSKRYIYLTVLTIARCKQPTLRCKMLNRKKNSTKTTANARFFLLPSVMIDRLIDRPSMCHAFVNKVSRRSFQVQTQTLSPFCA